MSTPIITVENIGKKYILDHRLVRGRNKNLREALSHSIRQAVKSPFRKGHAGKNTKDEFWALTNITFQVEEGEIIGIVGRNGAGKSTLLKILSRITEPTTGRARLRGRVASLLEVGTGFHPELTGRENIFLNGAILGMSKTEIRRKFDQIVDFAGVERFLDTPVKRYSSGMYVRLAFAVAAHIETEILIIDEVLAVGDAQFQKKCLGKMGDVAQSGRTVMFVSHNMKAVEALCKRAIVLESGRLSEDSRDLRATLNAYLFGTEQDRASEWTSNGTRKNPTFHISRLAVTGAHGEPLSAPPRNDDELWVEIAGELAEPDHAFVVGYAIFAEDGTHIYSSYQIDTVDSEWPPLQRGMMKCRSRIPPGLLNEGNYRIEAVACLHLIKWLYEPGVTSPHVCVQICDGASDSFHATIKRPGLIAPRMKWELEQEGSGLKPVSDRLLASR